MSSRNSSGSTSTSPSVRVCIATPISATIWAAPCDGWASSSLLAVDGVDVDSVADAPGPACKLRRRSRRSLSSWAMRPEGLVGLAVSNLRARAGWRTSKRTLRGPQARADATVRPRPCLGSSLALPLRTWCMGRETASQRRIGAMAASHDGVSDVEGSQEVKACASFSPSFADSGYTSCHAEPAPTLDYEAA
jgi:hypothetical protein